MQLYIRVSQLISLKHGQYGDFNQSDASGAVTKRTRTELTNVTLTALLAKTRLRKGQLKSLKHGLHGVKVHIETNLMSLNDRMNLVYVKGL